MSVCVYSLTDLLSPGVDFKVKVLNVDGKNVKLTVWDTAGQERFRTLTSSYYRGAHGIILVYDVERRTTFDNIQHWLEEVRMYATTDEMCKMLVANKIDKHSTRAVSRREGEEFARENNMLFMETSAKEETNVSAAFNELLQKILDSPELLHAAARTQAGMKHRSIGSHGGNSDGSRGSGCC